MDRQDPFEGYVVVTGTLEREGDQFVSYCPEFGTSSCGDSSDEAFENLGDAIKVHIDAMHETGELARFFRERNIRVDLHPPAEELLIRVRPGKVFTTFQFQVPVGTAT